MEKIDLYKRYIWLLSLIYRHNGITREEINRQWSRSHLNDDKENELPERTFHRHKKAIKDLFEIEIVCDRHGEKTYHIANRDSIDDDEMKIWLLNTFALNSLLSENRDLRNRIVFEANPSGQKFLTTIMEAMRDNTVISLDYQSFHMDQSIPHVIEPYCLKIYKQRWYVIGRRIDTDNIRTFALDRIKGIERTGSKFKVPDNFDAESYFADYIGITVDEDIPKETVRFIARNGKQDYIRSLPLHPSQQEISSREKEAVFEIVVKPTPDLFQEFLKFGKDVKILAPTWFEDKMREICSAMKNNYKIKSSWQEE
ncbi:MAG: WYL domain-containing protein [Muribaculaceae bacterium]|nr:WYL domain-containing protein [Muribaculaceae bacterium]